MNQILLYSAIGILILGIIYSISRYMKYLHKQDVFNLRLSKRIYKNKMHMTGHSNKEIHKNIKKLEEKVKHEQDEDNENKSKVGKKLAIIQWLFG